MNSNPNRSFALPRGHAAGIAAGFTMIELVVVIVIIGILATFAVPRFFNNTAFAEVGYADELAGALRQAQKVAVASGCDVSVSIDSSGYEVEQRASAGATCATSGAWSTAVLRSDGSSLSGTPPSGANIAAPAQYVFSPSGALRSGSSTSSTIGSRTLSVDSATGYVRVQ